MLLAATASVWFVAPEPNKTPVSVTLAGWTNINGLRHALLSFPPVTETPKSLLPKKWLYQIKLEITRYDRNGTTNLLRIHEDIGISARLPVGGTQIAVPLPETATQINVNKAEGVLKGYSEFHLQGVPIFGERDEHWQYRIPALLPVSTMENSSAAFQRSDLRER